MIIFLSVVGILLWLFFDELHKIRIRNQQAQQAAQLARLAKEQAKQAREQARIDREVERQASQLAKHEERIAKLEYRMEQAERDIEHWNDQLSALYAMLDYEKMEQAACVDGGKEWSKRQNKILTLENKVHTAESRLAKAEYAREEAQRGIDAA